MNVCGSEVKNAKEKVNRWKELENIIAKLENEISEL